MTCSLMRAFCVSRRCRIISFCCLRRCAMGIPFLPREEPDVKSSAIAQTVNQLLEVPLHASQAVVNSVQHLEGTIPASVGCRVQMVLSLKECIQSLFQARQDRCTCAGSLFSSRRLLLVFFLRTVLRLRR